VRALARLAKVGRNSSVNNIAAEKSRKPLTPLNTQQPVATLYKDEPIYISGRCLVGENLILQTITSMGESILV
jgi:hypothetical protein